MSLQPSRRKAMPRHSALFPCFLPFTDLYAQLLDAPIPEPQQRVMGEIDRDITRTFPRMQLFRQRGGLGQASLLRVLRAYALFNPQVGYCQGMST